VPPYQIPQHAIGQRPDHRDRRHVLERQQAGRVLQQNDRPPRHEPRELARLGAVPRLLARPDRGVGHPLGRIEQPEPQRHAPDAAQSTVDVGLVEQASG
jgi:hypothetical protein